MDKKTKEFLITFFLGLFGVHKFMKGNIKMGLLYLFTLGIFGIGWIADLIKLATQLPDGLKFKSGSQSLMGTDGIDAIRSGKLPNIQDTNLNLSNNEICCYMDNAYTFKDKTITTGYTGGHNGVSIRIMKGLSYRVGGSGSKAIRQTTRIKYDGILYITTKRIIYSSQQESFDKTFDKITSITEAQDGIIIQIGSHTYSIVVDTHTEFMQVYNLVKVIEQVE